MVPFVKDDPPMRADARRNRERVITAAEACFAEDGQRAQMDDIARRAGVGVGTVYRHFPDKEALLRAIAFRIFAQIRDIAAETLAIADPWEAFETMMWRCAEVQARNTGFQQALVQGGPEWATMVMSDAVGAQTDLEDITREHIERAKAAGAMRADASFTDVPTIQIAACGLMARQKEGADWRRLMTIALAGLRADRGGRVH